jgi:uncharacterized membrane-anchored protein
VTGVDGSGDPSVATPSRIPKVTGFLWVLTVLAATVGGVWANLLTTRVVPELFPAVGLPQPVVRALVPLLTATALAVVFGVALAMQLRGDRYSPARYWLAVLAAAGIGALAPDTLIAILGVPLDLAMIVCAGLLALVFGIWDGAEETLSLRAVRTRRREWLYWAAILLSFATGTAIADVLAELGLGSVLAAAVLAVCLGLLAVARARLRLNAVLGFWLAYVLACALGTKLGDHLMLPGGPPVAAGPEPATASFAAAGVGVVLVWYLSATRRDELPDGGDGGGSGADGGSGPADVSADAGAPQQSEAAFVEAYYAKLPQHSGAAFDDLTPAFQQRIGGMQGFNRRYREVVSVVIVDDPVVVGPHSVSVTVRARFRRGRTLTERLLLVVEPQPGGRLLLDDIVWRS